MSIESTSRKPRRKRSVTLSSRISQQDLKVLRANRVTEELPVRPRTRGECLHGENADRPCPFVSCKHHLYLDVTSIGSVLLNFPELQPWQLPITCSLDVADKGDHSLEEVGEFLGSICRERIRQIELGALQKLKLLNELAKAVEQ